MSATTTAICVIVMGTAVGTIRPPLPLTIWCLLGVGQLLDHQVEVPGGVVPVVDGAAAHDDVGAPAGDLGRVAEGHPAVHADQHLGPAAPGQVAYGQDALPGAGYRRLAGPAGADREDQDQV